MSKSTETCKILGSHIGALETSVLVGCDINRARQPPIHEDLNSLRNCTCICHL